MPPLRGIEQRITNHERTNATLTPPRHAPGEAGFHEHLASHRVAFAEPFAVMMQQLPRVLHQLEWNLQLKMRCRIRRLLPHGATLVLEPASERLKDVFAKETANRPQIAQRLRRHDVALQQMIQLAERLLHRVGLHAALLLGDHRSTAHRLEAQQVILAGRVGTSVLPDCARAPFQRECHRRRGRHHLELLPQSPHD